MNDVKFAIRQLQKNLGSTAVIVLTLGLVIGVCTTLFAVFNYQFFQPLPLAAPETLVKLARTNDRGEVSPHLDAARLREIQRQSRSFDGLAAFSRVGRIRWTGREEARHLTPRKISAGFFDVFGIKLVLGRAFDAGDTETEAHQVIIDHHLWVQDFNGDTNVIGRTMILDGMSQTIVGVMPRDVSRIGPASQDGSWAGDVWLPHDFTSPEAQTWFRVVGRLRAETTFEQAREEMRVLGGAIESELDPGGNYDRATVTSFLASEEFDKDEAMVIGFFLMTVVFVLLIACLNVTNLLIARSLTRRRELAMRLALGAGRWRLVRQLLVEFAALGLLGGALAFFLALWTAGLIETLRIEAFFDWRVIVFTAGVALFAGLLSGLAPALRFSRLDLTSTLKEGGLGISSARSHHRLRNLLVISQVAMVLVLLISSGLMIRSFLNIRNADIGYDTHNLAELGLSLDEEDYPDMAAVTRFLDRSIAGLRDVPGVEQVGLASLNVVDRYIGTWPFGIQGRVRAEEHDAPQAAINPIGADFFEIVNARVLRGATFNDADTRGDANVAVINQTLAERFFPGEDPVGQIIEGRGDGTSRFYRIIGIVADLKNVSIRNDPFPEIFIPFSQAERFFIGPRFLVRTSADPQSMAAALREAVLWVNPDQPLRNVRTVEDRIRDLASRSRILRYVMGLFGLLGFTLSMVGIYGVVSYAVNERTREIGVRIAMGAVRRDILLLILRQSLRLVVIGGAMGTLLALAGTFVLGNMLYAVSPLDPVTYFGVFIVVTLATVLASLVPARRAARVDPMTALRTE